MRIASALTPMPVRRSRTSDFGKGTLAMSLAGLALALANYLL